MARRKAKPVRVGSLTLGGQAPIYIQSMTNTDTRDVAATVAQILELEAAGCEIVRCSVYDEACAKAIGAIKAAIHIPLVADIHFNAALAVAAVENGVDKLRINPGNIGSRARVERVAHAARAHGVPIRVGVNSGSLSREMLERYGGPTAEALAQSALEEVAVLESVGFEDIVVAIKSTGVQQTVEANRKLAASCGSPLHLGVTESGTVGYGSIKSAVGIGTLLMEGIGDTVRVSLSGSPVPEVPAAQQILQACGLRVFCPEIISCPTCGRCGIDVEAMAGEVARRVRHVTRPLKIAVMGCVVNGPGEAREADFGLAGGKEYGMVFSRGKRPRKVARDRLLEELVRELEEAGVIEPRS